MSRIPRLDAHPQSATTATTTAAGKKPAVTAKAKAKPRTAAAQPATPKAKPAPAAPAKAPAPAPAAKTAVAATAPPAGAAAKSAKLPKPPKALKAPKLPKAPKPDKPLKTGSSLVRDSFTMPADDFKRIATLKARALKVQRPAKKSELLRAGLQVLEGLSAAALVEVLNRLVTLKPGRPKKHR
jgi:hypothetical protein